MIPKRWWWLSRRGASPWESCSWELSEVFDGEELEVGVVPSSCDSEGVGLEEV